MKSKLLLLALIGSFTTTYAQDIDLFIEGGSEDAEKLLENYFEPAFNGFAYGLTNGWANTAKPHQFLGFDFTITASVAFVPDKRRYFTFDPSEYSSVTLADPNRDQLPTVFGPNLNADEIPEIIFNEGTEDEVKFSSPTGLGMKEEVGFSAVPAPMIQAGIGLVKETDLKVRFIPPVTQKINDIEVSVGMLGFGMMHDIKQHIPAFAFSPFEISMLAGFSRIGMEITPDPALPDNVTRIGVKGATLQVLGSKDFIKLITVYGSVGLNGAFTRVRLDGAYEIESAIAPLIDPLDFKFSNFSPRATAGLRLNLALLTFHVDYTLQKYNTVSTGLGLSIR